MISIVESSTYEHHRTSLGRFENTPIAVGSQSPYNIKVEKKRSSGEWKELEDFPFASYGIYGYSMLTFDNALYLFGGSGDGKQLNLAVKYNGKWSKVGALLTPRYLHRSIAAGNTIIHLGGYEPAWVNTFFSSLFATFILDNLSSGHLMVTILWQVNLKQR